MHTTKGKISCKKQLFRVRHGESKHRRVKAAEQGHVSSTNELHCEYPPRVHVQKPFLPKVKWKFHTECLARLIPCWFPKRDRLERLNMQLRTPGLENFNQQAELSHLWISLQFFGINNLMYWELFYRSKWSLKTLQQANPKRCVTKSKARKPTQVKQVGVTRGMSGLFNSKQPQQSASCKN